MNDERYKKIREETLRDLSPEDRAFLEKVIEENKDFLEMLKNDKFI
jgi:hypothetical protein